MWIVIGRNKQSDFTAQLEQSPPCAWKPRSYPVPLSTSGGFRFKASLLRGLQRWTNAPSVVRPVTVMVPALYNSMPAESVALGWLNEIETLATIRHRLAWAAKITGWDVFTFHTLHNLDRLFDNTISALRDTWVNEGSLSPGAIREARRRFGKPYDYHLLEGRLVENLVFQSSILDWICRRTSDLPLRYHVMGTGLLSALVTSGALSFDSAVQMSVSIGKRWDLNVAEVVLAGAAGRRSGKTAPETAWMRFDQVQRVLDGRSCLSLPVAREDLAPVDAPSIPFLYTASAKDAPVLIETALDAANAMETMNIESWAPWAPNLADEPVRGWLAGPLHPLAGACRWTVFNYLLATPQASLLFLAHIAPLGRRPLFDAEADPSAQNRLRLSRMKVTGP